MKTKQKTIVLMIMTIFLSGLGLQAASAVYHTPDEVNNELKKLAGSNPGIAKLHRLSTSPGGVAVNVLEIGPETGKSKKTLPAIFVAANMEGTVPISSEAALSLARLVLEKAGERKDKTWYILALGNPDGAGNYFKKPLRMDSRNNRPHNDDMDDQTDEDGVEDLDGNGIITRMRVKDPQGQWLPIPGEPRLMKKADWTKGEKGIYKLYSEGIDNDGDGKYNEDGPGGVNVGVNFPHLFKPYTKSGGPWAGSEAETYELFKFIYRRPEIAMTLYLGSTNFCMVPPRGGRKGTADFTRIKVPGMMGERMGFDPDKTYTMKEILEKAQPMMPPGMELTEGLVASFLGLGPAVNPLGGDLKFYNAISEEYKAFLKKNKSDAKRLEPARAKDGSFELWAYYHLGIPSFSLDFWTLPEVEKEKKGPEITPEKLEAMSKEDFLALGEKKIDAFLKSANAPLKAKQLMKMVEGGMMTPKKMAAMMKNMPKPKSKEGADPGEKALLVYSDKTLKGKGFVEWKTFNHPTLGEVEIGGAVPYARNTPGAGQVKTLVDGQLPWVFQLTGKLPRISIVRTRVKALGNGVYRVKAWVGNSGLIPYPTAMGTRNKRIPPVVVTLTGQNIKIIEGKKRSLIKAIGGHGVQTVEWLVQAEKPVTLKLVAHSPTAWSDTASVKLTP